MAQVNALKAAPVSAAFPGLAVYLQQPVRVFPIQVGICLTHKGGLVDYCRVSCDVGLDWDDVWYMRLLHRERVSTKQAYCSRAVGL